MMQTPHTTLILVLYSFHLLLSFTGVIVRIWNSTGILEKEIGAQAVLLGMNCRSGSHGISSGLAGYIAPLRYE